MSDHTVHEEFQHDQNVILQSQTSTWSSGDPSRVQVASALLKDPRKHERKNCECRPVGDGVPVTFSQKLQDSPEGPPEGPT